MTLREILGRLRNVTGPSASGEYMARCPCHDDKTASLSVTEKASAKDGKRRIYLCCHAGCQGSAVMAALGVKPRDLIVDGDNGDRPVYGQPPEAPKGVAVHQAKETGPSRKEEPRIDFSHPTKVYSYTDPEGRELFQVCRYEYEQDGKREKTFRQRRYDPQHEKANREGYVASVPNELRDRTLYRLPAVVEAVRAGRPVYVVEGEKDVETLERLGLTATCNPGGAGKWRDGYNQWLRGADVVILPDCDTKANDYTGQNHAYAVALALNGTAQRVRLVDLSECAELPPKGDVSDLMAILGDGAGLEALQRQVERTPDFDPAAVPFWLSPQEQAVRLYTSVQGYGVQDGCIAQMTGESARKLTDFVVLPRMEMVRDDGVTKSLFFVLDGWTAKGRPLPRVTIPAKDLDGMKWVTDSWGFSASLAPGTATKDKVAWAIKKVGQLTARRVTEYSHTGWRKIGGQWCYLYHGGAIGREGVTVDMGPLRTYRLDGSGAEGFSQMPFSEAAKKSLRVQEIMKREIGTALLGTAYLAPLREFMTQTDVAPAFALYLYGESGTHKSTAAALAMAHFGNFHSRNAPASFNDTPNQVRGKAFLVKDMPLLVDDFHPTSSIQEKRQMSAMAQALSRAFGDSADRGRLNADRTIQESKPPRSVAIITGEDLPAVGASGLARFFILDIDKEDIPVGEEMTALQEDARKGWLQRAMRGYILWLQKQADELPERLHTMFLNFRQLVRKRQAETGGHDRAPEAVACILMGYSLMLNYMRDVGGITQEEAILMQREALELLSDMSRRQTRTMESEKPSRIFLTTLSELLVSKKAALRDLTPGPEGVKALSPLDTMVGYMDRDYYYLLPNVTFGAVQKLCREQGVEFPVSLKALYKHLRTDGIVTSDGDTVTRNKRIDGRTVRLLWIPRDQMDGPRVRQEQQRLDMDGYQDVTGEALPF